MRLSKIFFILLLFVLPFGELFRVSIGNATVHATDIMLVLLLPIWIFEKKPRFFAFSLFMPIVLFIGVLLFSLVIHIFEYSVPVLATSFLYTIRFVCYAMLLPIVFSFSQPFKKTIMHGIIISGGIIVALGYVQYLLYPNLRNLYYAGWDEHLYRMFSVFLDPNFAGAFFVCYFLLVIHVMPDSIRHLDYGQAKMTGKVLYGFISVLTLIAIALTYSRGVYIMLFVSLVVYVIARMNNEAISFKKIATLRNASLATTIGVVVIVGLLLFSPRSEGTNLLRITSSFARLGAVQNAVAIWQDNVLFGVGFNAYRYAQEKHGFIKPAIKENHAAAGTDNSFLFILATTGIVGLAAYVYMWYKILRRILAHRHSGKVAESTASRIGFWSRTAPQNDLFIATIAGLFVNALFVNSLFYPPIMLWVFIELGLTDYT